MPIYGDEATDPIIDRLNPDQGSPAGGTTVTITGNLLADATTATFATTVVPTRDRSETSVTCTTPAHDPGKVDVFVTNLKKEKSNTLTYTYK